MAGKSLFCIAHSRVEADEIVDRLEEAGFPDRDISVIFPSKRGAPRFHRRLPDSGWARRRRCHGGIKGLTITGTLNVPDFGLFVAAGEIGALICVAAVGMKPGGIADALAGLEIPERTAGNYARKIHDGNILISVNTKEPNAESFARRILEESGGEDIATTGESATSVRAEDSDTFAHPQ